MTKINISIANTPFVHFGICTSCKEAQWSIFDIGVSPTWDETIECVYCHELTVVGEIVEVSN